MVCYSILFYCILLFAKLLHAWLLYSYYINKSAMEHVATREILVGRPFGGHRFYGGEA